MRIIITKNGQRIIRKLYSSKSAPDILNNSKDQEKDNPLISNNNISKNYNSMNILNNSNIQKLQSTKEDSKFNSLLFSSNNIINMIRPQKIQLKRRNLRMPLSFLKRYEQRDTSENIIVQPMTVLSALESKNNSSNDIFKSDNNNKNSAISSNNSSSIFLPRIKSHYSIREIVPKTCLDKLDNKIKEKYESEKYDIPFNSKILRGDWSEKNIFKEIEKKKNKKINSNNYKLIEYLMDKTSISKNFLQKINECDEKKLNILDKLSGKVLAQKENQKIFDKKLRNKIERIKMEEEYDIRRLLLYIKTKVDHDIKDNHMNEYKLVKDSNKIVYRNAFKKFRKKYWKKSNNFARYFHKYQNVHFEEI